MSSASGIGISEQLSEAFVSATSSSDVRFLKITIQNETLVPDGVVGRPGGTLEGDLNQLQDLLKDDIPAYILSRQDAGWAIISYVPDTAKVRDKMLYASSKALIVKGLGSTNFSGNLFLSSKSDFTPNAFAKRRNQDSLPSPMSESERQIAAIRDAEDRARATDFVGTQARATHVGKSVGFDWNEEAESAVRALGQIQDDHLVVLSIDSSSETIVLSSSSSIPVNELASNIPPSEPSYVLYAWNQTISNPPRREIVFVYVCPTSSPIKNRMLYSTGAGSVQRSATSLLAESSSTLASRKLETSDPSEVNEEFLVSGLDLRESPAASNPIVGVVHSGKLGGGETRPAFARPKRPGSKR